MPECLSYYCTNRPGCEPKTTGNFANGEFEFVCLLFAASRAARDYKDVVMLSLKISRGCPPESHSKTPTWVRKRLLLTKGLIPQDFQENFVIYWAFQVTPASLKHQ
jgi:hypothetical protein